MKFLKNIALFCTGGAGYVGLELLWRGHSHSSMFLAGGCCFLLLGRLQRSCKLSTPLRAITGAGIITSVELLTGLIANRDYAVWDYRRMPANFLGQICLPYCLLWIPLSLFAMILYKYLAKALKV